MKLPNSHADSHASADVTDSQLGAPTFRNPFVYELKLTATEKIKMAVMSVTVFPVRLLATASLMLLAWPFALAASLGRTPFTLETQSLWRRCVDLALRVIMRAMWFCGGFHWIRVKGERASSSQAPILTLAPHSSYFDAIPVTMTMASIVARAESKSIPVWGTLINFIRPVFVSRADPDSRRNTVEEIKRRAQSGGAWPQIMIFPEGTCTNRSSLLRYKPGAFIPGVPVQPVVLRYLNKLDTITWTWQGPGAFKILWLTLCQFHNPMELEYLPVYTPSEEERRDPALFANNVRLIMAKALQLPLTELSFDDCQLSISQGLLHIPSNSSLLQFNRLVRLLRLQVGTTDAVLQQHASRARKLCGDRLGLEDFTHYLNLPLSEAVRQLHHLLDQRGDGAVDVRLYVVALSVVCRPSKSMDTLRLAFRMFEAEEAGVGEEDLEAVLSAALGVRVDACRLVAAMETTTTGKITYDELQHFAELHPNFCQRYLSPSSSSPSLSPAPPPTNGFTRAQRRKQD